MARRVFSQEAKATAFSADATTGNGNRRKSAELSLKKRVKSYQVNLFLAGFNHLKPQWRVASSVKKQRPQRTHYPGALKKTKIETAFRGQDKRVKIIVYTIRPYFLFHYLTNGENSNVNKRKTKSRIQRALTKVIIYKSHGEQFLWNKI